jgi:adenosylhomocysteine nucleosidase
MSTKTKTKRVAILGAMPQEISAFEEKLEDWRQYGHEIVLSQVGISKPVAAANTTHVIKDFSPDYLIFTGVAAGLHPELKIGDIGIVSYAADADLDVRVWKESPEVPDYKRGEMPFTRKRIYESDSKLSDLAFESGKINFKAYVATGSIFLNNQKKKDFVKLICPELEEESLEQLARPNLYDMESSAILQAADIAKVPALILRAVSDDLEGNAASDFNEFIRESVDCYVGIVDYILEGLEE